MSNREQQQPVTIDLNALHTEIVGELQKALGDEAELQRRLEQTRTRIAALRGQIDLLARMSEQSAPLPQQPPTPQTTPRGKPKE